MVQDSFIKREYQAELDKLKENLTFRRTRDIVSFGFILGHLSFALFVTLILIY
eukprot:GAHX01002753.1.p1 GENE.GAHX01002753.1~~GAHX01002753.1.p1  ORF type:complete len:53 (+),score=1.91 GAHX01002753.1:37-195(+)